jgi:hypothetical protein
VLCIEAKSSISFYWTRHHLRFLRLFRFWPNYYWRPASQCLTLFFFQNAGQGRTIIGWIKIYRLDIDL